MSEMTDYVVGFTDGTVYQFDAVVNARLDDAEVPAPRLTLELAGDTGIRINFATVKFMCSAVDYATRVRQR